jgi:nicotinamide-nucleotide amidase
MITATDLDARAAALLERLKAAGLKVVTAESCTGGLVAGFLTDIAGSSDVFERGFVTYSNAAKAEMLGVPTDLIERVGAVSEPVARAMAEGALRASRADLSVAITGVAGPGGGTAEKPVGLVHFAAARRNGALLRHRERRFGDLGRAQIRLESVAEAFGMLEEIAAMRPRTEQPHDL